MISGVLGCGGPGSSVGLWARGRTELEGQGTPEDPEPVYEERQSGVCVKSRGGRQLFKMRC